MPGDELVIDITSKRRGVQWGEIKAISKASEERIEPFCPHFGKCGGCQWQHIPYSRQLEHKSLIVKDTLKRIGKIDIEVPPTRPSPAERSYRTRVRLHWRYGKKKGLGFYKKRSHDIVPITSCPMLSSELNTCLESLSKYLKEKSVRDLTEVELVQSSSGNILVDITIRSFSSHHEWVQGISGIKGVSGITLSRGKRRKLAWGKDYIETEVSAKKFRVSSGSFFQANTSLLPELVEHIVNSVNDGRFGAEIYAGVCFFGVFISSKLKQLAGIEWNKKAILDGVANLAGNDIKNTVLYPLSADEGLSMLSLKEPKPSLILLDPPREGLNKEAYAEIEKISPEQIIYVSCDPATLARDLRQIIDTGMYKVENLVPFDMFPHTSHIETVVSIQKIK